MNIFPLFMAELFSRYSTGGALTPTVLSVNGDRATQHRDRYKRAKLFGIECKRKKSTIWPRNVMSALIGRDVGATFPLRGFYKWCRCLFEVSINHSVLINNSCLSDSKGRLGPWLMQLSVEVFFFILPTLENIDTLLVRWVSVRVVGRHELAPADGFGPDATLLILGWRSIFVLRLCEKGYRGLFGHLCRK